MIDSMPANDHNYTPDSAAISAIECVNDTKRKAEETEEKPCQIYSNNLDGLSAEGKRCYFQVRTSKFYPQVPKRIEDQKLTDEWTVTAAPEPKLFFSFDNGPDTGNRIITFASDESQR